MIRRTLVLTSVALALGIRSLAAQQPPCSYDECALRLKRSFWGPQLVQGRSEMKVARFTFTAARLDSLMQRSDSAARHYALFRTRYNRGFWLATAGAGVFGAGTLIHAIDRDLDDVAIGLLIAGTASWIVGVITGAQSREPLSKAVWWYNRSLGPSTP